MFSMLQSRSAIVGADVLDLYAGSGALGIEAISRGADSAVFVEQDRRALGALRENLASCRLTPTVVDQPAAQALEELTAAGQRFDLALLDPPYATDEAWVSLRTMAGGGGLLAPDAWVVVEHASAVAPPGVVGDVRLTAVRRYGKTSLSLYQRQLGENEP